MTELKKQPAKRPKLDIDNDHRPKVQLPGNDRLLSDFAAELATKLRDKGLYQRGGYVVVVKRQFNQRLGIFEPVLEVVTSQMLRTLVERHLTCYREHVSTKGNTINYGQTMTDQDAKGVLASVQFLEQLKPVERFATTRLPIIRRGKSEDADGTIELLEEGYDEASATLTISTCDYDLEMPFNEAKAAIDDLLAEFSFADDGGRSRAVLIAAMVGQYVDGLLPPGSRRPMPSVLANAEGAGKTLAIDCCLIPVHGNSDLTGGFKDEAEMNKLILANVLAGKSYLFFDNCKGYLSSPALEAFISASHWEGRILGQSKKARGENNTTVFISGNGCTFSPDLRRRGLFAELIMPVEFAEDRQFKRVLDASELLRLRPQILAALWAFLREWCEAGRPRASRAHGSFPRWAEVVSGIVEFAGYACPLERPEIEGMVDTDSADMRKLVEALNAEPGTEHDFEALVATCQELGLFEKLVGETDSYGNLLKGARSTLGNIFKRYKGRLVGQPAKRFTIEGAGHKKRFKVSPA